jgi:hypothetical protein
MAMTRTTTHDLLLAAAALVLSVSGPAASAKIVCWKNNEGVRECGNAVPPEFAQQSVERKSSMGLTLEKTDRARTAEEIERERAERERLASEKAEQERVAAEQARHDAVLLQTFTTEEDLKLAHDGKVAAIDSRIKHSEQIVERLEQSRTELQGDAASLERGGKKVPDELHKQITDVQSQIDKSLGEIERRKDERVLLQERFRADLARYRELKGG